jgi:hypothetical protein
MPQKKTTKKETVKRHDANNKTQKSKATVESYLNTLADERRADCDQLTQIMRSITKDDGAMWGPSIAGFGHTHLVYESGREMDWFLVGFSSRKSGLSVYIMGENETREQLLAELGPHKMGKGCLTIKRLSDIHLPTLKKLIRESAKAKKNSSRA